jgi:glycosyltransferase involved in cell wall biosynthesis
MALAELTDVTMLTTMHNAIKPENRIVWDRYSGYYNTISRSQWRSLLIPYRPQHAGTVYNGIDVASYEFCEHKDAYLLSLNRIHPEKGTHLAIEVARRTGRRLIIAGKWDPVDRDYYEEAVKPHVDGDQVIFVGEATQQQKRDLYAAAACVLMPITWEEPFGLVTVEAMASGTPVITFGRGAAPELVVDGETGFIVNDVDGMSQRIGDLHSIRPARCRQHVADNFDTHVMVNGYLRLYQSLLAARDGQIPGRRQAVPAIYLAESEASRASETVEANK